jgi:hypothetical protein
MAKCPYCEIKYKATFFNQKSCRTNDDCKLKESMAFIEKQREAKRKSTESLNKAIEHDKQTKGIQAAFNVTKVVVHNMIRLRDEGKPCISCGCQWNDLFQAGHLYSSGNFFSIRYDFYNINGQCRKCNLMKDGNESEYHLRLPNRIGIDEYNKLKERALNDKKQAKNWTKDELKAIRVEANKIIKKLK